jgi:hypothetical protein
MRDRRPPEVGVVRDGDVTVCLMNIRLGRRRCDNGRGMWARIGGLRKSRPTWHPDRPSRALKKPFLGGGSVTLYAGCLAARAHAARSSMSSDTTITVKCE